MDKVRYHAVQLKTRHKSSFHTYIHLFYIKENKGCNINSYTHRAITGKLRYPTWQLSTEQCWMSLKHLRALPSASWDPARTENRESEKKKTSTMRCDFVMMMFYTKFLFFLTSLWFQQIQETLMTK